MKLNRTRKLVINVVASLTVLMSSPLIQPLSIVHAVENINGIDVKLFEDMNNKRTRLHNTLDEYSAKKDLDIYIIRTKNDFYAYKLSILTLMKAAGDQQNEDIRYAIEDFNMNILEPLTDKDQIPLDMKPADIDKVMNSIKTDISNLAGDYTAKLNDIKTTVEGFNGDQDKIFDYFTRNADSIRMIFSSFKEFLNDYGSTLNKDVHSQLRSLFVQTYDKVIGLAVELNMQKLYEMNILDELADAKKYDPKDLGFVYKDGKLSPEMLSLIALTSTFRPLETNVNDAATYKLLTANEREFHKTYGVKRKLLFRPTDEYLNVNDGVNINSYKDIQLITLKEFLNHPDQDKVLFVDNRPYEELTEEQKALTEEQKKTVFDEKAEKVGEKAKETAETAYAAVDTTGFIQYKIAEWVIKSLKSLSNAVAGRSVENANKNIKSVVFASGDTSNINDFTLEAKNMLKVINFSHLALTNISEHYDGIVASVKLNKDMNRPLYIDPYGNILTASGTVVIPAILNRNYYKTDSPVYGLNVAFLESYPKFNVTGNNYYPIRSDKSKLALTGNQDGVFSVKASDMSVAKEQLGIGKIKNEINIFDDLKQIKKISNLWTAVSAGGGAPTKLMLDSIPLVVKSADKEDEKVLLRDVPNNQDILRAIYVSNLEYIAGSNGGKIEDKGVLDSQTFYNNIASEIIKNGTVLTNEINELVPEQTKTEYSKYMKFITDISQNRYDEFIKDAEDNNILYTKPVNEIKVLENLLPLTYQFIFLIALGTIILYVILSGFMPEGRWKQVFKILMTMALITFLITGTNKVTDFTTNSPVKWLLQREAMYWTLMEQERAAHQKEVQMDGNVKGLKPEKGTTFRVYQLPLTFPYRLMATADVGMPVQDFYMYYLKSNERFQMQNTKMEVKGDYLVSDTSTLFGSSEIVVTDKGDIRKKLQHKVYRNPELAFYLPYYQMIDSLVYDLNSLSVINNAIPHDIEYSNGSTKTTGRVHYWLNSELFLSSDIFKERVAKYLNDTAPVATDPNATPQDTEKATADAFNEKQKLYQFINRYGDDADFLGLRKLLLPANDPAPFTLEGINNIRQTAWYPQMEGRMTEKEVMDKIYRVNEKTRQFMMELDEVSNKIADEHLIKTIALFASLEFNKEFSYYNNDTQPQALELDAVPVDRYLMSMVVPRDDLISNSIDTYYNYMATKGGYTAVTLASFNDLLLIFINYVKPVHVVLLWVLTAAIIYVKKILIPDPNNRSILGLAKIIGLYALSSTVYALLSLCLIKFTNWGLPLPGALILSIVFSAAYAFVLGFISYALIKDFLNVGNSVLFKGLEKSLQGLRFTVENTMINVPLVGDYIQRRRGDNPITNKIEEYEDYARQRALKYSSDLGSTDPRQIVDIASLGIDKVSEYGNRAREKASEVASRSVTVFEEYQRNRKMKDDEGA